MSSSILTVPKSYLFYCEEKNRHALELLGEQSEPSPVFTWEEIGKFYQAQFAYELTKFDYYMFLRTVWEQTWGKAIAECGELKAMTAKHYNATTVNGAWEDGCLISCHKYRDTYKFCSGVCNPDVDKPLLHRLYFFVEGPTEDDYSVGHNLKLPENLWLPDPDEADDRISPLDLWQMQGDSVIVDALQEAAKSVVFALRHVPS